MLAGCSLTRELKHSKIPILSGLFQAIIKNRQSDKGKGYQMEVGDEIVCTECGETIHVDQTDLDEGEAMCTTCGNFELLLK